MSYKAELQNNNARLQGVLDQIENMPEGGGGGGGLTVTATTDNMNWRGNLVTFTTDHTYAEILDAINSKTPVTMWLTATNYDCLMVLPFSCFSEEVLCFGGIVALEVPGSNGDCCFYMRADGTNEGWAFPMALGAF